MTDSNRENQQAALTSNLVMTLRAAGEEMSESQGRLYWIAADAIEEQGRDIAERDKIIAAAGRATQLADERAEEIERLNVRADWISGVWARTRKLLMEARPYVESFARLTKFETAAYDARGLVQRIRDELLSHERPAEETSREVACGNPVMINKDWYGPCTKTDGHEGECDRSPQKASSETRPLHRICLDDATRAGIERFGPPISPNQSCGDGCRGCEVCRAPTDMAPETAGSEQCDVWDPDHGTWRCEKPKGHQGCHEVHGKTAYVSWAPNKGGPQRIYSSQNGKGDL